jgi:hypothetical protein
VPLVTGSPADTEMSVLLPRRLAAQLAVEIEAEGSRATVSWRRLLPRLVDGLHAYGVRVPDLGELGRADLDNL